MNVSDDGRHALVDLTTDAEDEDNERLTFRVAQPLGTLRNVKTSFRQRN